MNKFAFLALLALVAVAAAQEFTADNEEIMDARFGKHKPKLTVQGNTKNFTNPKRNFTNGLRPRPIPVSSPLKPLPTNRTWANRNRTRPPMSLLPRGLHDEESSEMSFFDDETEYLKVGRGSVSSSDRKNRTKKNGTGMGYKGYHVEDEEEFEFDDIDADEIEDHVTKRKAVRLPYKNKTARQNRSQKVNKTNKNNTNKTGNAVRPSNKNKTDRPNKSQMINKTNKNNTNKTGNAVRPTNKNMTVLPNKSQMINKTNKNNTNNTGKVNKTKGFSDRVTSIFSPGKEQEEEFEVEFDAEEIEDFLSGKNKTVRSNKTHKISMNNTNKVSKIKGFFEKVKNFFFPEKQQQEEEFEVEYVFEEEIEDFVARNKTGGFELLKKNLTKKNATKDHPKKNETKKNIKLEME